jgi:hypothetical protein
VDQRWLNPVSTKAHYALISELVRATGLLIPKENAMLHLVKTGVWPTMPAHRFTILLAKLFPQRNSKQERRRFDAAVRRSLQRCTGEHWRYTEALFDEHFLCTCAAPLLDSIFEQQRWPTPQELALAWRGQFDAGTSCRLPPLHGAVATATAFLRTLRQEWQETERTHRHFSTSVDGSPRLIGQR